MSRSKILERTGLNRRDLLGRLLPVSAALGFAAPMLAWAQDARFSTSVSEIRVDATVTQSGEPVRGLIQTDFIIRDNGEAQTVLAFDEGAMPLDLVVLLGVATFGSAARKGVEAAEAVVRQMRPQDRMAIVSFAHERRMELALTSDTAKASEILRRPDEFQEAGGLLPLLAIQWGIWLLEADIKSGEHSDVCWPTLTGPRDAGVNVAESTPLCVPSAAPGSPPRKRAILMLASYLGDRGQGSHSDPDEPVIQQLWGLDVAFHALIYGDWAVRSFDLADAYAPLYRIDNLAHIALATGGEMTTDLQKGFPDVLAGIRSTYSLFYRAPRSASGTLRRLKVELSDSAKKKYPGAEVRTREGYLAR